MNPATRTITYDLPLPTVLAYFDAPPLFVSTNESGIHVFEWACGCTACETATQTCAMQWCTSHVQIFKAQPL